MCCSASSHRAEDFEQLRHTSSEGHPIVIVLARGLKPLGGNLGVGALESHAALD